MVHRQLTTWCVGYSTHTKITGECMVQGQVTLCGKVTYSNNIGGYYRGHSRCRNLHVLQNLETSKGQSFVEGVDFISYIDLP